MPDSIAADREATIGICALTARSGYSARLHSCPPGHGICRRRGLKTCVVSEVADRCPHTLNENTSTEAQKWIWKEQILAELRTQNARPDVMICDRSLMCNLCYLALVDHPDAKTAFSERYNITHEWMRSQYDYVCRLPLNETWLRSGNNPLRSTDIEFARRVDAVMGNLVQRYVNIGISDLIDMLEGMKR